MARLPRSTFPDYGVWHATTRGVERRAVYLDRDDGRRFLTQLWQAVERLGLHVHALCLMPNHYHLVVQCLRDRLSRALHRVNGVYAEDFNAKYTRSGHLWGDRFALWQVRDDEHLRATCEYVLTNPVRAGLCERTDDWPWCWSRYASSSASSVISGTPASACETGQPFFAASAASRKPSASRPGTLPRTVSALFVIPVPGTNVTTAEVWSRSGGLPALARPMRERHREARRMRRRDQLLRARLPARSLLRACRPADIERPEGARADLVNRSRPAHQVAVPRHRCPALSSHVRSS